jgi:two-component system response regulator FixJ
MNEEFLAYIVDDDDSVRSGLSRVLRASGYQTKAFGTPEQFLKEVTRESVGCILLDVTMHERARRLRPDCMKWLS